MIKSTNDNSLKIMLIDDLTAEDSAMLQALYSRSAESAEDHVEKAKTSSGAFMKNFYVGYGHASIGDTASTTLFIENVSILAAKAIQDNPLYNGQETSTRYIDMEHRKIIDPIGTELSKAILDRWMNFYRKSQTPLQEILRSRYPKTAEDNQTTYDRAIKARCFDILRGFLPAGITTQLSWHTNLRQASDNLTRLDAHPLKEVRDIATKLRSLLHQQYPSSGFGRSHEASVEWSRKAQLVSSSSPLRVDETFFQGPWTNTKTRTLNVGEQLDELLATRPKGAPLPPVFNKFGQFQFQFWLDYGSFRDLQRHRSITCDMPVLTESAFEPWYLDQLGELRQGAETLLEDQQHAIALTRELHLDVPERKWLTQYYIALGFQVPCNVTATLPGLVYLLELRTGKTVHPTLRAQMLTIAEFVQHNYSNVDMYIDEDPDDWDVRRGNQTITAK